MSKEKFTQGEWYPCCGDYNVAILDEKGFAKTIISYNCDASIVDDDEINANQHLIAAAPDMYRMLKNIEEDSSQVNVITIRRLLAKARGKL